MSVDDVWLRRLKKHWKQLIEESMYRGNLEELSENINRTRPYLRGFLRNNSVPGADVIAGLSRELRLPIGELMMEANFPRIDTEHLAKTISDQVSRAMSERLWRGPDQPTGEDVMKWWLSTGGRLENCDFIEECYDLFEVPSGSEEHLQPYRLGQRSLSTIELGTASRELFDRTVCPLDREYRLLILKAQRSSLDTGPVTTIEGLDAVHPDTGAKIKIEYTRTLAPVAISDGRQLILNYSKLLRKTGEVSGDIV